MLVLGLVDVPWWVLLITVITGYLWFSCRNFNYFKNQGIPGPQPYPILGTALDALTKAMPYAEMDYLKNYGAKGCVGEFSGDIPSLTVYDGDMLSDILVKEFSSFTNRLDGPQWSGMQGECEFIEEGSTEFRRPPKMTRDHHSSYGPVNLSKSFKSGSAINDNMLTVLEDAHWKHVRSEMSPTFTTGKLKKMNQEINRCASSLADSLEEQARAEGMVEMKEYTGGYAMDAIASTAFGIRVNSQKDRNNEFVTHAKRAFDIDTLSPAFLLIFFFYRWIEWLVKMGLTINLFPKDTQDFFENVTRQAIEMRKTDKDQTRTDFIQLMIKAQAGEDINDDDEGKHKGTGLTTDEILANAALFFVAGYDTTSTSLSFFMYNMALYPEVQDKLVDEINAVVGNKDIVDTMMVQEMPYLDQCINENLRMYPPAVRMNRVANSDVTVKGVFIRKGVIVNLPIYGIHHDPAKWPEPEKFDPERFSPENRKNRNPYHFIPFGNGPRNCIGMRLALQELKVAVIQVLRKVKVSTCEKTQVPIIYDRGLLLKAKGGIHLKVEPRVE